jgi:hypothetical protein
MHHLPLPHTFAIFEVSLLVSAPLPRMYSLVQQGGEDQVIHLLFESTSLGANTQMQPCCLCCLWLLASRVLRCWAVFLYSHAPPHGIL